MKKTLFITSAMVSSLLLSSGAALSAEWDVKLGGHMNQYIGFAATDRLDGTAVSDVDVQSDAEIHFLPAITLENGMEFGIQVVLPAKTDDDQIDEAFLFVKGNFGELILGDADGASEAMHYGLGSQGLGLSDAKNWVLDLSGELSGTGNFDNIDADSAKIRLISPRFSGVQVGLSYAPEATEDDDGFPTEATNGGATAEGIVQGAINYDGKLGNAGFGISGAIQVAMDGNDVTGDNFLMTAVGANLALNQYTLSGAYSFEIDPAAGIDNRYNVGASVEYSDGPVGASIGLIYAKEESNTGVNDTQLTIELGGSYSLGPGVSAVGSIFYGNRQDASDKANGFAAVGGVALSF